MDQYLYIPFLGDEHPFTSYFDVNYRGIGFWPIPISLFSANHFTPPPPGLCVLTISQGPQSLLRSEASPVNGSYVWLHGDCLNGKLGELWWLLSYLKYNTITHSVHSFFFCVYLSSKSLLWRQVIIICWSNAFANGFLSFLRPNGFLFLKIQPAEISDLFWFLNMDWFLHGF